MYVYCVCVGVAFEKYRSALPSDFNVVEAGGWNNVVKLSEDPKTELVSMIAASIKNQEPMDDTKVAALVGLLHARGKGFSSSLVDGDWIPVYSKQAKKSNKAQKIVSRTEKGGTNAYSNFLVQKMIFENINYTPRKNGILKATVKVRILSLLPYIVPLPISWYETFCFVCLFVWGNHCKKYIICICGSKIITVV